MRAFAAALFLSAITTAGYGAPPENADPALSPWFKSLEQPGTGISCCSIADCRPVEWRTTAAGGYEALVTKENFAPNVDQSRWVDIPPDKVLQRTDNPTGRAVMCWRPSTGVMCFIRGTET